jgi:hypothetical protein
MRYSLADDSKDSEKLAASIVMVDPDGRPDARESRLRMTT